MAKDYIGSGKKHREWDQVKVTIDLEKAKTHIYEYNGKKYLTFDVCEKKEVDQYGKTHTVSVFTPDTVNSPIKDDIPF